MAELRMVADWAYQLTSHSAIASSIRECRALPGRPENARAETVIDKVDWFREQVVTANDGGQRVACRQGPAIESADDSGDRRLFGK